MQYFADGFLALPSSAGPPATRPGLSPSRARSLLRQTVQRLQIHDRLQNPLEVREADIAGLHIAQ